jgi:hypothetical protein
VAAFLGVQNKVAAARHVDADNDHTRMAEAPVFNEFFTQLALVFKCHVSLTLTQCRRKHHFANVRQAFQRAHSAKIDSRDSGNALRHSSDPVI